MYFWMPISFGMDRGRIMMRHMMKRANLWSVYQWYGISSAREPVIDWYKEIHTAAEGKGETPEEHQKVRQNLFEMIYSFFHCENGLTCNLECEKNALKMCLKHFGLHISRKSNQIHLDGSISAGRKWEKKKSGILHSGSYLPHVHAGLDEN